MGERSSESKVIPIIVAIITGVFACIVAVIGLWQPFAGRLANIVLPAPTPVALIDTPMVPTLTNTPSKIPLPTFTPTSTPSPTLTNTPTLTPTPTPRPQCTVNVGALNLRKGPGTQFDIIIQMTNGTPFEGVERTADAAWIFGASPQASGWASAAFLDCTYDLRQLPVATTLPLTYTPRPTDTATPTNIPTYTPVPSPELPTSTPTEAPAQPSPTPSLPPLTNTPTPTPTPSDTPTQAISVSWEFETEGDTEGWTPGWAGRLKDTTATNGSLVAHIWTNDPFWVGPVIALNANSCNELRIRYRINAANVNPTMQFMWTTDISGSNLNWIEFGVNIDNSWQEKVVYNLHDENFRWEGTITQLRIDPVIDALDGIGGSVEIDYVRLCPP